MGERGPRQVACDSDVIRVRPRAACCRLIPQRGRGLRPATLVADHVYVTASQRNGTPSPRSLHGWQWPECDVTQPCQEVSSWEDAGGL